MSVTQFIVPLESAIRMLQQTGIEVRHCSGSYWKFVFKLWWWSK